MSTVLRSLLTVAMIDAGSRRVDRVEANAVETFDLSRLNVQLARRAQPLRLALVVDSAGCKVDNCVEVDGLGADGKGSHIIRFARGHDPGPMPKGKPVVIDAYIRILDDELGRLWVAGARRVW